MKTKKKEKKKKLKELYKKFLGCRREVKTSDFLKQDLKMGPIDRFMFFLIVGKEFTSVEYSEYKKCLTVGDVLKLC